MTLGQGHDTPLGHGQQLCEILSRSNVAVRNYGLLTQILGICALWPWPWRYDLRSRSWHNFGLWTTIAWNIIKIHGSEELHCMAQTWILGMYALWPWHKRYVLGSRSCHTLWSWTISVWNIIQIQLGSEELWPGHRFSVCVHCDLDLWDSLVQGLDTSLGHGKQLCKILSRFNLAVRSYGLDTNFGMCALWPWH